MKKGHRFKNSVLFRLFCCKTLALMAVYPFFRFFLGWYRVKPEYRFFNLENFPYMRGSISRTGWPTSVRKVYSSSMSVVTVSSAIMLVKLSMPYSSLAVALMRSAI